MVLLALIQAGWLPCVAGCNVLQQQLYTVLGGTDDPNEASSRCAKVDENRVDENRVRQCSSQCPGEEAMGILNSLESS